MTHPGAEPGVDTGMEVLEAPAKLTLSLRVVGVRNDGFHLVDAEMITLALHDTFTGKIFASGATPVIEYFFVSL